MLPKATVGELEAGTGLGPSLFHLQGLLCFVFCTEACQTLPITDAGHWVGEGLRRTEAELAQDIATS